MSVQNGGHTSPSRSSLASSASPDTPNNFRSSGPARASSTTQQQGKARLSRLLRISLFCGHIPGRCTKKLNRPCSHRFRSGYHQQARGAVRGSTTACLGLSKTAASLIGPSLDAVRLVRPSTAAEISPCSIKHEATCCQWSLQLPVMQLSARLLQTSRASSLDQRLGGSLTTWTAITTPHAASTAVPLERTYHDKLSRLSLSSGIRHFLHGGYRLSFTWPHPACLTMEA